LYSKIQQPKKIYELVAEQIRSRILRGELKQGDRLDSVEQLAKQFQVGRSTIREALSALRAMGLVDIRQGEGTFVASFNLAKLAEPIGRFLSLNQEEMLEFFEVRKIIESGAAGISALKHQPHHLEAMRQALDEMERAAREEDGDTRGEMADAHFHLAIAEATQNSVLVTMMNQISDTLKATMRESRRLWLFSENSTLERLHQEHLLIYQAIADRNASLAEQLMLSHLSKVEQTLLQMYRKPDEPKPDPSS